MISQARSLAVLLAFAAVPLLFCSCSKGGKNGASQPAAQPPLINHISPSSGPVEGGTLVVITGENFTPSSQVFFGEKEASQVEFVSPTRLEVVSPSQDQPGAVTLTVKTENGEATLPNGFSYEKEVKPFPEITSVDPSFGPLAGGNLVEIRGDNFQETTKVFFGDKESEQVTFVEVHLLKAKVPAGDQVGSVDVTVQTEVGSFTFEKGYSYVLPEIYRVSPAEGLLSGGTEILVEGEYLLSQDPTYLFLGSNQAQILENENTFIRALTPPGVQPGPVDVTVRNGFGEASLAGAFTYVAPSHAPEISGISPTEASAEGGAIALVYGSGFKAPGLRLELCGREIEEVFVIDDGTLQFIVPSGEANEVCDLSVTTEAGSATLKQAFRYSCAYPNVQILFPAGGITNAGSIPIEGKATDTDGVKEVRINDQLTETQSNYRRFSFVADLQLGENIFVVSAEDNTGCRSQDQLSLRIRKVSAPLLLVPTSLATTPQGQIFIGDFERKALLSLNPVDGKLSVLKEPVPVFDLEFFEGSLLVCYRSQIWETDTTGGPLRLLAHSPFALFRALLRSGNKIYAVSEVPPAIYEITLQDTGEVSSQILSDNSGGQGPAFGRPTGIASLSDGRLVVCDRGTGSLFVVNPDTGHRQILSGPKTGSGPLLLEPVGLASIPGGLIAVLDQQSENFLVAVDEETGDRRILSGPERGKGPFPSISQGREVFPPADVEFDPETGKLLIADPATPALWLVDPANGNRQALVLGGTSQGVKLLKPQAIADFGQALLVLSRLGPALIRVDKVTGNRSIVSGPNTGSGPLPEEPIGLAAGNAVAYVSDQRGVVFAVDTKSGDRTEIANGEVGSGPPITEGGPLCLSSGTLYVVDQAKKAVISVDLETLERSILTGAGKGSGPQLPDQAVGIAVLQSKLIVVGRSGVLVGVDLSTGERRELAQLDALAGGPTGVAPLSADAFAVLAVGAVFSLQSEGGGLQTVTGPGKGRGPGLLSACGITADSEGRMYVLDSRLRAVFQIEPVTGDRIIVSR